MAKHILRFRQTDRGIFENIRNGRKTVETRAATAKFKNITPGDTVVFICGNDRLEKKVKKVGIFKSIPSLLGRYKLKSIMPHLSSEEELKKAYYGFSGYKEKIKKSGLIAIEFKSQA